MSIYFGVGGIFVGLCLVLIRFGIFEDHASEVSLGMFIFLLGYAGVIAGCRWWLKAKDWNEAIVFIGFMPLVILFIPFVRLIFLTTPLLAGTAMVMAPLILIVVVFALPDKSEAARPKAPWERE